MHARMIQATAKPGQLKELVKTLVDRSSPFSNNSKDLSIPWL